MNFVKTSCHSESLLTLDEIAGVCVTSTSSCLLMKVCLRCTLINGIVFPFCRYGLGMIYYKQEKFSLAEMHFQKALDINPQSSVLLCHIGVVSRLHSALSLLCSDLPLYFTCSLPELGSAKTNKTKFRGPIRGSYCMNE